MKSRTVRRSVRGVSRAGTFSECCLFKSLQRRRYCLFTLAAEVRTGGPGLLHPFWLVPCRGMVGRLPTLREGKKGIAAGR